MENNYVGKPTFLFSTFFNSPLTYTASDPSFCMTDHLYL